MMRRRLIELVESPLGVWVLVLFALLEATVFPGPTEAMLVALVLANRERSVRVTAAAVGASVAGGVIGYHLGASFFSGVLEPVFASYGYLAHVDRVVALYRDNAFAALSSSGYTPIPYMLYTAMAGVADVPVDTFVSGSLVGRALKYAPLAAVAYVVGPRVHEVMRRVGPTAAAVVVLALVVWVVVR